VDEDYDVAVRTAGRTVVFMKRNPITIGKFNLVQPCDGCLACWPVIADDRLQMAAANERVRAERREIHRTADA
jgi:hypothetical protein